MDATTQTPATATFPAEQVRRVRIQLMNVDLTVSGEDRNDIQVHVLDEDTFPEDVLAEARGDELVIEQNPGRIRQRQHHIHADVRRGNFDVDIERTVNAAIDWAMKSIKAEHRSIEVHVPKTLQALQVQTASGDIVCRGVNNIVEVSGASGDVEVVSGEGLYRIKLGSGDLEASELTGDCQFTTGSGDQTLRNIKGRLQSQMGSGDIELADWQGQECSLMTGSGDIEIQRGRGDRLKLNTASGDINLRDITAGEMNLSTVSGDIEVSAVPQRGQWKLETRSGDITLTLPKDVSVRIDAATRIGEIESDFALVKVGRQGPESRMGGRMVGNTRGDDAATDIHLVALRGDISLRAGAAAGVSQEVNTSRAAQPAAPSAASVQSHVAPATQAMSPLPSMPPMSPTPPTPPMQPVHATAEPPQAPPTVTLDAVEGSERAEPALASQAAAAGTNPALLILESLSRGEISISEADTLLKSLRNR